MVGSVSATEQNDDLQITNDTDTASTGEDAVMGVSDSDDILDDTAGNFSELQGLIDDTPTGGTLTLQKNFAYASGDSTGGITISKQMVINGNGKTIDGGLLSGYNTKMFIVSASDVVITHLNFKNARYCYQGPGIFINSNANRTNITYCTFDNIDNRGNTNYNGGVIYILSSNSYVDHCNFTNCYCNNSGCLNYFSGAKYGTVTNSYFENCSCRVNGGAIESYSDTGYFENLTFRNCSALSAGGAIVLLKGAPNTQIVNCHFYDCSANNGGGVYSNNPDCINTSYINCDFQGCSARTSGGAIYFNSANTTITLCSFSENSANSVGGAIYSNAANSTIDDCTFVDNTATDGSNYYASSTVNTIEIVNCDFDLLYVSNGGTGNGLTTQTATNWTYAYGKIGLGKRLVLVGTFTNLVNITIGKSVVIEGYNNAAIIDLGKHGRAFVISGNNVVVTGITFKNGQITGNGGAILWEGSNGNLTNCNFTDNVATGSGGAIYWSNTAYIDGCTFEGNNATSSSGGAVNVNNGAYSQILNSVFKTSWSRYNGGAVHFLSANGLVNNTQFIGNYGGQEGGAIEFEQKNTIISYCLIENNTAGRSGGGVWWGGSTGNNTMFKCTINNNTSPNTAGGIGIDALATTTINYCNITNNKANSTGGGIYSTSRTGNNNMIMNSILENNSANNGGGIYITLNTTVTDCNFTNNTAIATGGAMYWGYNGGSISNVQFSNNNAPDGADIYLPSSSSEIEIDDNIKFDLMYVTDSGTGNGLKRDTPTNWTYAMSKIEEGGRIVLIGDFSSWTVKTIDKSITVEGSSATLTAASNNGFFIVNANNAHIDNLVLKNMVASTYAIVWNGEGGIISNSTFTNNRNSGKAANIKSTIVLSILNNTFDVTVNYNTASLSVDYDNNFAVTATLEGMDLSSSYANLDVSVGSTVETTTQMKNTISFSLAKRLPGTYTLNLATTDSNTNTYNYLSSSNTTTLTVNRLNTIYIGPSATGSGNGTSTSNLATWDGIASRLSDSGTIVFANGNYNLYGKSISKPWTLTVSSASNVIINGNGQANIFSIDTTGVKINNLTLINANKPITGENVVTVKNSVLENQIQMNPDKTSYVYGDTITITGSFGYISPSTISAYGGNTLIGTSAGSAASYSISRNGDFAVGSYTLSATKKQEKRRIV